MKMMVYKEV